MNKPKCKYCSKEFAKESTLAAHLCEPKRRWQQEKDTGVQFGLRSYLRFYEITQGSARFKSYEDFVTSPYYTAFVKFGQYCVSVRAINFNSFTEWLLKNNKKLDHWCKDTLYDEWLRDYVRKEAVSDALERALKEMQCYAEDQNSSLSVWNHYFLHGNTNRICHHISTGRISPWVVYNCGTGVGWLDSLGPEQIGMVMPYIDPDFWNNKFTNHMADVEWCKHILKTAGL